MAARLVVAYGEVPASDLLRLEVARFHGVPLDRVALGHHCPRCGDDDHGRPVVLPTPSLRRPAHVSIARAGTLSVVAVAATGPVGVDVERTGAAEFDGYDDVARHVDEDVAGDRTRAWVRKEALLKADGLGLAIDPRDVALDEHGITRWESDRPRPTTARLRDVDVPGHVASVVVLGLPDDAELSVVVRPVAV